MLDVFDRPKRLPGVGALVVAVLENETTGRRPAGVVDLLVQWRQSSGFEVDEQRDPNQHDHERDNPAGDERDLDERCGSLLAVCGDLMTMPGLPKEPAAARIDVSDDGVITGI